MKFKKQDYVLVKPDFKDEILDFTGFGGRVQRVFSNGIVKVVWDSITLKTFSDAYIKEMIENEYYLFDFNFREGDLVKAEPRDTEEEMYKAQEEIYEKGLAMLDRKIEKKEEYYDRFMLSRYYTGLTIVQQDKSWDIINIFSTIMLKKFRQQPDQWKKDEFEYVFFNDFRDNVVASKTFFRNSGKVLLEYLKFLNERYYHTSELQKIIKEK